MQAGGRRFDPDRLHGAWVALGVVTARVGVSDRACCVTAVGRGVWGLASVRRGDLAGVDVVFVDCESGSGAFLDAQDVSGGLDGMASAVRFGRAWEVRDGLAWVV